ncbi:hypothetical protein BM536_010005 [Streptomyces phaeoluteigriseus]|uniref:Uncharacterized protein n=1 Tax=Streptomyces phaeoluteigriseus TaxID=114686 RepID=A0A1V6MW56_9ACTN|nr:hypothetical protein BM536_010005 [Streptomyces phaeoluteigriseus]
MPGDVDGRVLGTAAVLGEPARAVGVEPEGDPPAAASACKPVDTTGSGAVRARAGDAAPIAI